MTSSTGRLGPAPDDHSDAESGAIDKGTAPQHSGCVNNRCGAGPTHNLQQKVPTMAKSTRGPDPVDRVTRISGVKITPPTLAAPVPTTPTIA